MSEWPERASWPSATATRDPRARVWATDGTADWLLWRLPDLRGRIAFDVRFELYDAETIERLSRYGRREGADWISLADGYDVVIVDEAAHLRAHLAEPGARLAYKDTEIALVSRASPSRP